MHISIIIVNYNVRYFLEQCLCSVQKAIKQLEAEVIVVDNNSNDDSIAYLQPKYPFAQFICNKENVGFSKANNQALQFCTGNYILYLNPDTIIPEDCLLKCIEFIEMTPDCGALGIKMIDGSGTFLPESKRGFPSPLASFFKLTGLADVFPRSKLFNKYSLGYLSPFNNHKVDVLAGAFIMARSTIIKTIKGFDEAFFMYGEDIDLSFRIQKLGYNNYYFADSTILHFKGESTKKGSLNYVKMFYSAMSIFVHKHYSENKARVFSLLIHLAIFFRASISLAKMIVLKIGLPLLDALIIFCCLWKVENVWVKFVGNAVGGVLDNFPLMYISFVLIFMISGGFFGMYDNPNKPSRTFLSSLSGTFMMVMVYGLLPPSYRLFSSNLIVAGGLMAGIAIAFLRWILLKFNWIEPSDEDRKFQQTAVVGSLQEYERVVNIYIKAGLAERLLGRIKVNSEEENAIGDVTNLKGLSNSLKIKEIIFCEGYLTNYLIIQLIQTLPKNISYRFMGNDTQSIVGSNSKATVGETLAVEQCYRINEPSQKRMKRLIDVIEAICLTKLCKSCLTH